MEYRLFRDDAVASGTRQLEYGSTVCKSRQLATNGAASRNGAWTGSEAPVSVQANFQEFLAQATTRQASPPTGEQAAAGRASDAQVPTSGEKSHDVVHILKKGETVWELARKTYKVDPSEILRHNGIDNPNALRAGQKIRIPLGNATKQSNSSKEVVAGWYGEYHHGRLMANGERFDMHEATIAHRSIPIGSEVELENPKTGEKARGVVTDRGPYHRGRDVDLSYGLAKRLSIAKQGVGTLKMRVL